MLATTSRHACLELKKLALNISKENNFEYINRGKKTVEDLVLFALKKGHDEILIIHSKDKKEKIKIHNSKNWEWI